MNAGKSSCSATSSDPGRIVTTNVTIAIESNPKLTVDINWTNLAIDAYSYLGCPKAIWVNQVNRISTDICVESFP
jgi:hypothetical protein